ncbi:Mitogen-activated protein kinase kinase kinase ANP1 [Diplonema papillatum]|nr:Mitogen-activated protein kinase kinase kinase ANP1 [Diplonema papillatum]
MTAVAPSGSTSLWKRFTSKVLGSEKSSNGGTPASSISTQSTSTDRSIGSSSATRTTASRVSDSYPIRQPQALPRPPATGNDPLLTAFNPCSVTKRQEIGRGGFGVVYLGIHNATGEQLAIKEIPYENVQSADMLLVEFELLKKLKHPNVVEIRGCVITYKNPCSRLGAVAHLYLEYVAGGSVFNLLQNQRGRLHELLVRKLMRGAVAGLQHLHDHNVLHRDIKPHNLLVDTQGNVKVADFGCCKELAETASTTGHLVGTPYYMAPEAIKENRPSRASDIWSVAATIIELATGKRPWTHDEDRSGFPLIYYIATAGATGRHPMIPDHLSVSAKNVLKRCFGRPEERPTCTELLADPFFQDPTRATLESEEGMETLDEFCKETLKNLASMPDLRVPDHVRRADVSEEDMFSTIMSTLDGSSLASQYGIAEVSHHHHHHHHHGDHSAAHHHHHHHHHQHHHQQSHGAPDQHHQSHHVQAQWQHAHHHHHHHHHQQQVMVAAE